MRRDIYATVRRSAARERFLDALAADLERIGGVVYLAKGQRWLRFTAALPETASPASSAALREEQISRRSALVARAHRRQFHRLLASGSDVDFASIAPALSVCEADGDHDVFSFCKLQQSVPSSSRPGRRIRLLVKDVGQSRPLIIGAIELASPVWTLAARDRYLGWSRAGEDKAIGLRRTMDLATCIAMPPYSYLRAGKLLAAMACSSVVSGEFKKRYEDPLLAIFATCATGLHYPQLNRVKIGTQHLYRRIGQTGGYSATLFSQETVSQARILVQAGRPSARLHEDYLQLLWVLRGALRACNLPEDPILRIGAPKGVYVGALASDAIEALSIGANSRKPAVATSEAIAWWKHQVLRKTLMRDDLRIAAESFVRCCPPLGAESAA